MYNTYCVLLSPSFLFAFSYLSLWSFHSGGRNLVNAFARVDSILPVLVPVWSFFIFPHPAVRFYASALHSKHCSIPVHASPLGMNLLSYDPTGFQSPQTLCLRWPKCETFPYDGTRSITCTSISLVLFFSQWSKPTSWEAECPSTLNVTWKKMLSAQEHLLWKILFSKKRALIGFAEFKWRKEYFLGDMAWRYLCWSEIVFPTISLSDMCYAPPRLNLCLLS